MRKQAKEIEKKIVQLEGEGPWFKTREFALDDELAEAGLIYENGAGSKTWTCGRCGNKVEYPQGHSCPALVNGYSDEARLAAQRGQLTNPLPEPAEEIVTRRQDVYGDPVASYARLAQIWSGILDHEVSAHEVALCMIGLKVLRTAVTPDYADNSDDIEGYLEIFRKIIGDDMVAARSVSEYLEKLAAR